MRKRSLSELGRASVAEFKQQEKYPLVMVLDNIRSAHNVGSAFRTSDAFGCQKLVLCGITATPPHRDILKTAIGATASVEWAHFETTAAAIHVLKNEGFSIVGVEQTDRSISLDKWSVQGQPVALVFGNEVEGISTEVLPLLDYCLEIPQFGTKHSLNVSVCCGIVGWEWIKQNKS